MASARFVSRSIAQRQTPVSSQTKSRLAAFCILTRTKVFARFSKKVAGQFRGPEPVPLRPRQACRRRL